MATRKEVRERCAALRDDIHISYKKGILRAGTPVASVRELATRFGLSKQVAYEEVQKLVADGLLYSVPGSGTFFGTPPTRTDNFFLIVDGGHDAHSIGFAQRVATLGGASLSLPSTDIRIRDLARTLPSLAGVWDSTKGQSDDLPWGRLRREVARVGDIGHLEDPEFMGGVGVDNHDGGQKAAMHMIRLGHRRVAYLGVHAGDRPAPSHTDWSEQRENGWREAMQEASLPTEQLSFHPDDSLAPPEVATGDWSLVNAARSAARRLVARTDITAVIAANDDAALAYVRLLHEMMIPLERWPVLIGYDNLPNARGQILSSFHRPLDLIGATAAEILWECSQGIRQNQEPVSRLIPMTLLPRITSESGWAVRMHDAVSILLQG